MDSSHALSLDFFHDSPEEASFGRPFDEVKARCGVDMMQRAEEILAYWFDGVGDQGALHLESACLHRWFGKDAETAHEMREQLEHDHQRAAGGELSSWKETPRGRLALVILLDQLPR